MGEYTERAIREFEESSRNEVDDSTKKIYKKYGLGEKPTFKEIESKAIELLSDIKTCIDGAELVLGRRTESGEDITKIFSSELSAKEKYELLLMQRTTEEIPVEKYEKDMATWTVKTMKENRRETFK